jgi:hypothetical protein
MSDKDKIVSTHIKEDTVSEGFWSPRDVTRYTATVVTEDGSVGSGSCTVGMVNDEKAQEIAVTRAIRNT